MNQRRSFPAVVLRVVLILSLLPLSRAMFPRRLRCCSLQPHTTEPLLHLPQTCNTHPSKTRKLPNLRDLLVVSRSLS